MYNIQELCLHFVKLVLTKLVSSSIFSLHSSTNLSTNLFLHLQFSQYKHSPKSHDLSHSYSQLLGFQAYPISHTPLLINSLHSHRHLSSSQRCLLLQTFTLTRFMPFYVSCPLVLDIRLNTLKFKSFTASGAHMFAYGSLI